jgi:hypothetical protein
LPLSVKLDSRVEREQVLVQDLLAVRPVVAVDFSEDLLVDLLVDLPVNLPVDLLRQQERLLRDLLRVLI